MSATKSTAGKKTITIRLIKSRISCTPKQRATMTGLGLKRPNDVRSLENTPAVRGMIKKIIQMVEIVSQN
jgi:large subunit ribosomal protein L30